MKKALPISLSFIFLLNTLGISFVVGYCPMKKGYSFSFPGSERSCCCGKADKGNCCKSHKFAFKITKDNFTVPQAQGNAPFLGLISTMDLPLLSIPCSFAWTSHGLSYKEHHPPELPVPFSILFCSLQV
jgi:hypothetical protein